MPQLTMPEIKLSDLGDRLHDASEDLPHEVRERIGDAGDRIAEAAERVSEAGGRLGSDVGDRLSELRWPSIALPAALRALPDVRLPSLSAPSMRAPRVELPDLPHVDARDLRRAVSRLEVPQITVGKPKAGPPVVPLLILAAVGGAFVGWWLATSSFASRRIRGLVNQARARLGLAHDWDEGAEQRTEDFWADERGWQTGAEPLTAAGHAPQQEAPALEAAAGDVLAADWPSAGDASAGGAEREDAVGSARTEGTGGQGFEPDATR